MNPKRGVCSALFSLQRGNPIDLSNDDNGIPSPIELLETILHAIIGE
jgi:hypothetical protein